MSNRSIFCANSNNCSRNVSLELSMEFLSCVLSRDFDQALVLCRQILESDPENQDARNFLPLLQEASHMKSTGYFHLSSDESDSSDNEEEHNKHGDESSSDSSDSLEYSSSDSDSDSEN